MSSGTPKRKKPPIPRPRQKVPQESGPEIKVEYGPAGRDTMAAIAEDVATLVTGGAAAFQPSSPDLSFELAPAGRETLSAIVGEAKSATPIEGRTQMSTLDYEQRFSTTPDIEVGQSTAGRETMAAIARELSEPSTGVRRRTRTRGYDNSAKAFDPGAEVNVVPSPGRDTLDALANAVMAERAPESEAREVLEVFEMATFVVRGADLARLSSESARRQFVSERLLGRLPARTMEEVDRVDVTPWTVKNTVILRVWCRVAKD